MLRYFVVVVVVVVIIISALLVACPGSAPVCKNAGVCIGGGKCDCQGTTFGTDCSLTSWFVCFAFNFTPLLNTEFIVSRRPVKVVIHL